jgi:GNAT superfamily N-acetyltransferase
MMDEITIRPINNKDRSPLEKFLCNAWGETRIVVHGSIYFPAHLLGFLAERNGDLLGAITYQIEKESCELVSLNSLEPGKGTGIRLIEAVHKAALEAKCKRMWLITTNDNLNALRFYQRRGFRLKAVYPGAVDTARYIKPSILQVGDFDIPLHDEIELEMILQENLYYNTDAPYLIES